MLFLYLTNNSLFCYNTILCLGVTMSKHYDQITTSISESVTKFTNESSEFMQHFRGISQTAFKPGQLDQKTKEMIALATGIAKQCDGCIGFHIKKLIKLGLTREELMEMLNVVVYMGGGPALMYAADTILAFEQFSAAT